MIITRKHLSRRTLLRGLGATIALPLLDGMVPALTALSRTAAKPTVRFGAVYVPNGMAMKYWTPAIAGAGFEMTPILEPLAPFRDRLLVISGLDNMRGYGGPHASASSKFLSGVKRISATDGPEILAGVSIDQMLARHWGQHTQLASLELALDGRDFAGTCDAGYSCGVHELDLLAHTDDAATDGEQPACGVRAVVRRQREHRSGRAARTSRHQGEHRRLRDRQGERAPADVGTPRSPQAG